MANLWALWADLNPPEPRVCGTVIAHYGDGSCAVELLGGGVLRVRGQDIAVGQRAFVLGGNLDGAAPSGEFFPVEI